MTRIDDMGVSKFLTVEYSHESNAMEIEARGMVNIYMKTWAIETTTKSTTHSIIMNAGGILAEKAREYLYIFFNKNV